MSWLSSLFTGSNPTLSNTISQTGQLAGYSSGVGEGNASAASNFFQTLLSGDQSKIGQLLAPETSAIQKQGQQKAKTSAEFGNRSGGTTASNETIGDSTRSAINDMVSNLLSSSASGAASLGTNLIGQGLNAYTTQANMSQQQMQNWQNSILGRGITGAVSAAESFGLGAAGGALSGTGAGAGGMAALLG